MLKFTLLCLLSLAVFASQDVPIPSRPDGFSLGSNTPNLHIEAYYDLLCPDSRDNWGILEPILRNEYNITKNHTLKLTIHLFPLPYHINAFTMAQGARVIADNLASAGDVFSYFNLVFANQEQFYTPNTQLLSPEDVQVNLLHIVDQALPAYAKIFADGLEYGNQYDSEARVSWKYGCYRGVTGTPTYFANGVAINGGGSFQAQDWRNFLNGGFLDVIFI